jgi:hypothetical protein
MDEATFTSQHLWKMTMLVVYQTGTWTVDGVQVGDGTPPKWQYARVENVQIVSTHNCEHGVIRV